MDDAKKTILTYWGAQGQTVIDACHKSNAKPMTYSEFLSHCFACGGDWGAMLLTGIKALYPAVYDVIPDKMGSKAWFCLASVIELLGVKE